MFFRGGRKSVKIGTAYRTLYIVDKSPPFFLSFKNYAAPFHHRGNEAGQGGQEWGRQWGSAGQWKGSSTGCTATAPHGWPTGSGLKPVGHLSTRRGFKSRLCHFQRNGKNDENVKQIKTSAAPNDFLQDGKLRLNRRKQRSALVGGMPLEGYRISRTARSQINYSSRRFCRIAPQP